MRLVACLVVCGAAFRKYSVIKFDSQYWAGVWVAFGAKDTALRVRVVFIITIIGGQDGEPRSSWQQALGVGRDAGGGSTMAVMPDDA